MDLGLGNTARDSPDDPTASPGRGAESVWQLWTRKKQAHDPAFGSPEWPS